MKIQLGIGGVIIVTISGTLFVKDINKKPLIRRSVSDGESLAFVHGAEWSDDTTNE